MFNRSSFHNREESAVTVSNIGARALPPLYHTATGKNAGWLLLARLISERSGPDVSRTLVFPRETFVCAIAPNTRASAKTNKIPARVRLVGIECFGARIVLSVASKQN